MNGFEVIYRLLSDESDRERIFSMLPTIQADINMLADDILKIGRDIKILNNRITPLVEAMQRVSG